MRNPDTKTTNSLGQQLKAKVDKDGYTIHLQIDHLFFPSPDDSHLYISKDEENHQNSSQIRPPIHDICGDRREPEEEPLEEE